MNLENFIENNYPQKDKVENTSNRKIIEEYRRQQTQFQGLKERLKTVKSLYGVHVKLVSEIVKITQKDVNPYLFELVNRLKKYSKVTEITHFEIDAEKGIYGDFEVVNWFSCFGVKEMYLVKVKFSHTEANSIFYLVFSREHVKWVKMIHSSNSDYKFFKKLYKLKFKNKD